MNTKRRVVVIGGGFAGLAAARTLDSNHFEITLIDRENFHLFQPLLYQVATGSLGATDIATPLRTIVSPKQARVVQDEMIGIDFESKVVLGSKGGGYPWDILILANGLGHNYFGNDQWSVHAPSLKYLSDAFTIRDRVLGALELAEAIPGQAAKRQHMRFVVIGGGPTGIELAGAIGELAGRTLAKEFSTIDPRQCEVFLLEGGPRVLPQYPENVAEEAVKKLNQLGVEVITRAMVREIDDAGVLFDRDDLHQRLEAATVLWAAGAAAAPGPREILTNAGISLDRAGRVLVDADFQIPNREDIYVIGDAAAYTCQDGLLPGLAPAAEQAGNYVGRRINGTTKPFEYKERGHLAVIGRNAAVGEVFGQYVKGRIAWWLWLLVHINGIIGFDVKLKVIIVWAWKILFDKYGARVMGKQDKR